MRLSPLAKLWLLLIILMTNDEQRLSKVSDCNVSALQAMSFSLLLVFAKLAKCARPRPLFVFARLSKIFWS